MQEFLVEKSIRKKMIVEGGRDIEFRDPTDPKKTVGVQVKTTYHYNQVLAFLWSHLRLPVNAGVPGLTSALVTRLEETMHQHRS